MERLAARLSARGLLPDLVVRFVIRALLWNRLREEKVRDCAIDAERKQRVIAQMRGGPVALVPEKANEQHYEVPESFYRYVLGPRRKYSACSFRHSQDSLAQAEEQMLAQYAERARIEDGMAILDLGCGWGSFTLWLAERYPHASIIGVSNSHSQRRFIEACARERGLKNVEILTADINELSFDRQFDRIVSIEMFEHTRNWERLLAKLSEWLTPTGRLLVHIFCHRAHPYFFEVRSSRDWLSKHFFSGGIMPSADLLLHFQRDIVVEQVWHENGLHYSLTARAWHRNLLIRRHEVLPVLSETYGEKNRELYFFRWKLFFLACEELFGYRRGNEWFVAHYLCSRRA